MSSVGVAVTALLDSVAPWQSTAPQGPNDAGDEWVDTTTPDHYVKTWNGTRWVTWAATSRNDISPQSQLLPSQDPNDAGTFISSNGAVPAQVSGDPGVFTSSADIVFTEDSNDPGTFLIRTAT